MGRDLYWYVIPKHIEHDTAKEICLSYEFQGDEEDVNAEVYEKITNKSALFDYKTQEGETMHEYYERRKKLEKDIHKVMYDYKYEEENRNKWCPKCHMFVKGLYDCSALIDTMHIGHSYSSLYWTSRWNIKDMYLGDSDTEFIKLFRNDYYYREITHDEVVYAIDKIKNLGTPLRNSDIEACEETMNVLNFLDKWTKDDNYHVIMEDEP